MASRSLDIRDLTPQQVCAWRKARWLARNDLQFLCNNVLDMPDVTRDVHGPLLDHMQKFPEPNEDQYEKNDLFVRNRWVYKPILPLKDLPGDKRRLILDFRGSLKTSINCIAHSVQVIINYPDIAMAIFQSNGAKAADFLGGVKQIFTNNQKFRALFPEHAPKKINDWGTMERFTTPARSPYISRREPTMLALSIDKGTAGYHFDWIKFSDIVDPNNTNENGLVMVRKNYYQAENLLVAPGYPIEVEGTRYDFSDLYGFIIESEEKLKPEQRSWSIYVRGVFEKDTKGKPRKYDSAETFLPDKLDLLGNPISIWPDRFKVDNLLAKKRSDQYIFACQQENNPANVESDEVIFPIDERYPRWISRQNFIDNVTIIYYTITVDTAETDNERSNHSVITVGGWDRFGKCYVVEIDRGKWLPDALIKRLIMMYLRYQHACQNIQIEKTSFTRGLETGLKRDLHLLNLAMPLTMMGRETNVSKKQRIKETLQPWYINEHILFLEDLACKEELLKELKQFPRFNQDDILDTLSDLFQGKKWLGREIQAKSVDEVRPNLWARYLDPFDTIHDKQSGADADPYYSKQGFL